LIFIPNHQKTPKMLSKCRQNEQISGYSWSPNHKKIEMDILGRFLLIFRGNWMIFFWEYTQQHNNPTTQQPNNPTTPQTIFPWPGGMREAIKPG